MYPGTVCFWLTLTACTVANGCSLEIQLWQPLSCDLLGNLLNAMFYSVHALTNLKVSTLENLNEIIVFETVITIRCHFYTILFKEKS